MFAMLSLQCDKTSYIPHISWIHMCIGEFRFTRTNLDCVMGGSDHKGQFHHPRCFSVKMWKKFSSSCSAFCNVVRKSIPQISVWQFESVANALLDYWVQRQIGNEICSACSKWALYGWKCFEASTKPGNILK